jgi:hypothetical protein
VCVCVCVCACVRGLAVLCNIKLTHITSTITYQNSRAGVRQEGELDVLELCNQAVRVVKDLCTNLNNQSANRIYCAVMMYVNY